MHGAHEISEYLTVVNDILRIAERLRDHGILAQNASEAEDDVVVPSPLEELIAAQAYPLIEVEFASLRSMPDNLGTLTLVDTPGPDEAGQPVLEKAVKDTLRQASAVFAVLDYTRIGNQADAEMRQKFVGFFKDEWSAKGRGMNIADKIIIILNKYEESGDISCEFARNFVHDLFRKSGIPVTTDHVFPVSALRALLASQFYHYMAQDRRKPGAQAPDWMQEYQRVVYPFEDYGRIPIAECVRRNEIMWEKARMGDVLNDTIRHMFSRIVPSVFTDALGDAQQLLTSLRGKLGCMPRATQMTHSQILGYSQTLQSHQHLLGHSKAAVQEKLQEPLDFAQKAIRNHFGELQGRMMEALRPKCGVLVRNMLSDVKLFESFRALLSEDQVFLDAESAQQWLHSTFAELRRVLLKFIGQEAQVCIGHVLQGVQLSCRNLFWDLVWELQPITDPQLPPSSDDSAYDMSPSWEPAVGKSNNGYSHALMFDVKDPVSVVSCVLAEEQQGVASAFILVVGLTSRSVFFDFRPKESIESFQCRLAETVGALAGAFWLKVAGRWVGPGCVGDWMEIGSWVSVVWRGIGGAKSDCVVGHIMTGSSSSGGDLPACGDGRGLQPPLPTPLLCPIPQGHPANLIEILSVANTPHLATRAPDVVIHCAGGAVKNTFKALLCAHSTVLKSMLEGQWQESREASISLTDFEESTVTGFLNLCAFGIARLSWYDAVQLFKLYHLYDMHLYLDSVRRVLRRFVDSTTAIQLYAFGRLLDPSLKNTALSYIKKHPGEVLHLADKTILDDMCMEAVAELIKDDHFVADEREIFNFVWRWGRHHQNKDQHLHQTIGPLMPLLRWNLMDSGTLQKAAQSLGMEQLPKVSAILPRWRSTLDAGTVFWLQKIDTATTKSYIFERPVGMNTLHSIDTPLFEVGRFIGYVHSTVQQANICLEIRPQPLHPCDGLLLVCVSALKSGVPQAWSFRRCCRKMTDSFHFWFKLSKCQQHSKKFNSRHVCRFEVQVRAVDASCKASTLLSLKESQMLGGHRHVMKKHTTQIGVPKVAFCRDAHAFFHPFYAFGVEWRLDIRFCYNDERRSKYVLVCKQKSGVLHTPFPGSTYVATFPHPSGSQDLLKQGSSELKLRNGVVSGEVTITWKAANPWCSFTQSDQHIIVQSSLLYMHA